MKQYYSIFNDVLGPVMNGPSSSHSAGCARIGRQARLLYGKEIGKAEIIFEKRGSYPKTYKGQGSDFGFTGGLLGMTPDDRRLKDAVKIARETGREITFSEADLGFRHPNQAKIIVYGDSGEKELELMTFSVGGGMFEISEMDGFSVKIDGGDEKIFVLADVAAKEIIESVLKENNAAFSTEEKDGKVFFTAIPEYGTATDYLDALAEKDGVRYVRHATPVLPVVRKKNAEMPFFCASEALEYMKRTARTMDEAAVDYECALGEITPDEIREKTAHIREVMEESMTPPDGKTTPMFGFLPYSAEKMQEKIKSIRTADTGVLNKAMLAAVSVMENSCAHNIIVASPTAGSSGVVPAAVVCIGRQLGASDEEIDKALLACALVGVFIANQATFGGEVGACQAENGSASAMAAAGVVSLLGGDAIAAFRASSMALQNMLGLICDPIGGLTEIPCISRNVSALSNAVTSANMALCGFDPVIPLDETIITMKKVGEQLPSELRCTCGGGLCMTKTGKRIVNNE